MRFLPLGLALLAVGCAQTPLCPAPASWIAPATGRSIPSPVVDAARRAVVLLGERHDQAGDHRWELTTLAALADDAAGPHPAGLVLGLEMFPRRAQSVLDRWNGGELTEPQFLAATDWAGYWGFDAALYLPIFRFARDHHVRMVALNVDHALTHLVAHEGWDAVPVAEREDVGTPASARAAYQARLDAVFSGHGMAATPVQRARFTQAQLVWDRAMAERLARARAEAPGSLVVGMMGAGHLEHRDGVPYQLASLGLTDVAVLLPWTPEPPCARPPADLADAVWITRDPPE